MNLVFRNCPIYLNARYLPTLYIVTNDLESVMNLILLVNL